MPHIRARRRTTPAPRQIPAAAASIVLFAFLAILFGMAKDAVAGFAINAEATAESRARITVDPAPPAAASGSPRFAPHTYAISTAGQFAVHSEYSETDPGSSITVVDLRGEWPARTIPLGRHWRPFGVCLAQGDSTALVAIESSRSLLQVDLLTGDLLRSWEHGLEGPCIVASSPDSSTAVVVARNSGKTTRIDLTPATLTSDTAIAHTTDPRASSRHALRPIALQTHAASPEAPLLELGRPIESLHLLPGGARARARPLDGGPAIEFDLHPLTTAVQPDPTHALAAATRAPTADPSAADPAWAHQHHPARAPVGPRPVCRYSI